MMLCRHVTLSIEAVVGKPPSEADSETEVIEYIVELQRTLNDANTIERKHLKQSAEYNKRHYDLKATKQFMQIGQHVWLCDNTRKFGVCPK